MCGAIIIRAFEAGDLDEAAVVVNSSARQAYAFFRWNDPVEATRRRLAGKRAEWSAVFVAEIDGKVRGFLALAPNFVDQIFVDPACQGRGAGRKLLDEAKHLYPDHLELDCAAGNWSARRFYERNGFKAVAEGIHEMLKIREVTYRWERPATPFP